MKVYKVDQDANRLRAATWLNYQDQTDDMRLRGVSLNDCWHNLALKSYKPKRPTGLFIEIAAGDFILSDQAEQDKVLISLLEPDGEFLPVTVDGKPMRFHNITRFTDCLDDKKSRWEVQIQGMPRRISHPSFIPESVPLGRLFRLKEYPVPRYVATDPTLPPNKDFYQWYHHQGYDGLLFKLMWDSDKPDELHGFY